MDVFRVLYSEKMWSHFWLAFFLVPYIVEENSWHIWSCKYILKTKHVLFMKKCWLQYLTLFNLTSVKSQVGWYRRVKWPPLSIYTCKMTQSDHTNSLRCRKMTHGPEDVELKVLQSALSDFCFNWSWPSSLGYNFFQIHAY